MMFENYVVNIIMSLLNGPEMMKTLISVLTRLKTNCKSCLVWNEWSKCRVVSTINRREHIALGA